MRKQLGMIVLLLAGVASSTASGAAGPDPARLSEALSRPILEQGQPLSDLQRFLMARLPRMPEVSSRSEWEREATRMRTEALDHVIFRGEAAGWRRAHTRVEWLGTIEGGPGYHVKKLRYEALPGLWIPALLYEPDRLEGKVPVVLNVNGHDRPLGKAAPYKQIRCINQAKRGMLALNVEWLGMGQLNTEGYDHALMNAIDLCGTSGIATHYLAMTRAIDILLAHDHADPSRVAVTGLSGGGWQTIFVSAFDTRVTLSVPVAGYSSFRTRVDNFSDLGDSEQTPCDLATATDYAPMTAMMAPRPTMLVFNARDNCCFAADHALPPLLEAAWPVFGLYGMKSNLRAHVNDVPGDHNYALDNRQALYRMLGDHFFPHDRAYDAAEIPSDAEVRTKEQLAVPLPADNASFHTIALSLSRALPRDGSLPADAAAARRWQTERHDLLREIVRFHDVEVNAESSQADTDLRNATYWTIRLGETGTVPAVELKPEGEAKGTTILVADAGRKSAGASVSKLLESGQRVLAVDPYYLGESAIGHHDSLFAMLVGAVGDRPLGLQASQLAAIARWTKAKQGDGPVTIHAIGPRSSLAALVAAAVEAQAIDAVELHKSLGSLKEVIEQKIGFGRAPEYFCFGLLERFDITQLAALIAPRPVRFVESSDRVRQETGGLNAWYRLWQKEFEAPR